MPGTFLVIGLGNPGPKYTGTRHNIGQQVLDGIAASTGSRFTAARRASAQVLEGRMGPPGGGARTILAKPTTYMNLSGGPVRSLADYYKVEPGSVIVVHDDVDLPFDTIRLKRGGGEGGHNGLRDTSRALGTRDYLRVRIGVGRPTGRQDTADYVLSGFSSTERPLLDHVFVDAQDAIEKLVLLGLTDAQQHVHAKDPR